MSQLDWIILVVTLLAIIAYGLYKSRTSHNLDGYFLSNRSMPWGLVLLSIMGTQASAITFLAAPGQAYTEGMGFVQYYFGLPLAMVVICIFFVPIFSKLKVYTAYEYLETRFDGKTRTLTSFLFLLQRGLSTGISVFAPSIILSSLLGWNIYWTNLFMGGLLIIYTMTGGAKAVAYTQQLQLVIIFIGMFLAGYMVVNMLPANVGFTDALKVSGELGRLNVIDSGITKDGVDWSGKYNLLSGLIGGFFLSLSYFGADQSQVGRYLTAKSVREAKPMKVDNNVETFTMQFANIKPSSVDLQLLWENTAVSLPISADVETKVMAQIDNVMNKDNRPYFNAAMYYLDTGKDLNQALAWFDKAIELNPSAFWIHHQRANTLAKLGKKDEAKQAANKSMELAREAKNDDYVKLNEKLLAEIK